VLAVPDLDDAGDENDRDRLIRGNRMVPLPTAYGFNSSPSSATISSFHGKRL